MLDVATLTVSCAPEHAKTPIPDFAWSLNHHTYVAMFFKGDKKVLKDFQSVQSSVTPDVANKLTQLLGASYS